MQMADTGAVARVQAAIASTADTFMLTPPVSFIRASNVVSLADWRRRRRAAR